jgi:putative endonuclease
MFHVYVLRSQVTGRFYVGCSKDVRRRLVEHNAGKSKSTKAFRPFDLMHEEAFPSLGEARKRERYLKAQKSKRFLANLVGLRD